MESLKDSESILGKMVRRLKGSESREESKETEHLDIKTEKDYPEFSVTFTIWITKGEL